MVVAVPNSPSIYSIGINQYKLIYIYCKIDFGQHIMYGTGVFD